FDLDLEDENPVETIPQLMAVSQARILALTRLDDKKIPDQAILSGARGILDKQATAETFIEAITKVHHGQLWLDRAATGRVFVEFSRREHRAPDPEHVKISALT